MKAIILVDLENEWVDENSEYYVGNVDELIEKTNKLIDFGRKNNHRVIFVRHVEKDSVEVFAENSDSTKIISEINKKDDDIVITKYKISPFYKTDLEEKLIGVDGIIVGGVLTNLCVRSTIQDAYDRDFQVTVIKDCCKAYNEETQGFTFKDLKETRPEIHFLNLDDLWAYK